MEFNIMWPNGNIEAVHAESRTALINSMWGSSWDAFVDNGGRVVGPDDEDDEESEDEETANSVL